MSTNDELDRTFRCPSCGAKCGVDDICGCSTLRCPSCGHVFEPDEEEEKNGDET